MIRILIIDDAIEPEFVGQLRDEVEGSMQAKVQTEHINPTAFFKGGNQKLEIDALLDTVAKKATEFWDAALIDLNLAEVGLGKKERLNLSLVIADRYREVNKSSFVILYSGTLSDYVKDLLQDPQGTEQTLKRIFRTDVAAFSRRDGVRLQVIASLSTPSFLLTLDRALVGDAAFKVSHAEAEFSGMTFGQLATSVRCQDKLGVRLTSLVAQHGLAAIVDLAK